MTIGVIEGFFFKLKGGDIFYAKGVAHPPKGIVSFPKYVVDVNGDRVDRNGTKYRKIPSIDEEYVYVLSTYSRYIDFDWFFCRDVVMIPTSEITYIYNPMKKAEEIAMLSTTNGVLIDARDMVLDIADSTGVKGIGISGSILVELHRDDSDIDIVVYGKDNGFKVYRYLEEIIGRDPRYRRYRKEALGQLYLRRAKETPISFEQMLRQESRRVLEGFFRTREYFIRLVKYPWEEPQYGSYKCRKLGKALLKLKVVDAEASIYTPCRYKVELVEYIRGIKVENITEVYSLRGRFNEIAREDDVVEAFGTVELIEPRYGEPYYRLYLGDKNDYMVVTHI